jgi:Membrane protein involved in the export of O-antigen and teichoic acid
MNNEITKFTVISSLFWKFIERAGTQGIQFIIQIILARILAPNDYGVISLIAIFINIANVFVQCGLNSALIQKKDADDIDFSSIFYLILFIASFLYSILFITAPLIADFYNIEKLKIIIRVLSITLFFGALNSIQYAVISKEMQFKRLFFSSLSSMIISGAVGIIFAYIGFGVWALVSQQLINQLVISVVLWFTVKWRPKLVFSYGRAKGLFSYGWKLLISALLDTIYLNVQGLFMGKIYNPTMLGFYNRGDQFPQVIVSNINGSIQTVMFPALAKEQDNMQRVKDMVRRSIVSSSFIIFPMMIGLAIIAEPLVKLLLTDKWLPCVPFMQIACMYYALYPIHTANLQAIKAIGCSDIFLKLEIIKKIVGFTILGISIHYGVYAIAIGTLINGNLETFIDAYPNCKLFNYSIREQVIDILPSMAISILMGVILFYFKYLHLTSWLTLIIQIFLGSTIYIGLAKVFNLECYLYLIKTFKDIYKVKIQAA